MNSCIYRLLVVEFKRYDFVKSSAQKTICKPLKFIRAMSVAHPVGFNFSYVSLTAFYTLLNSFQNRVTFPSSSFVISITATGTCFKQGACLHSIFLLTHERDNEIIVHKNSRMNKIRYFLLFEKQLFFDIVRQKSFEIC